MKTFCCFLCIVLSFNIYAEQSIFVGLYSDHSGYAQYKDYNGSGSNYKKIYPLNQGGPNHSRLIGYMYTKPSYSLGICTFKNSFYEQTYCILGLLRYSFDNPWSIETGLNLTYGYRPALIMQMASLSTNKNFIPIPIVGIKYDYEKYTLSYNHMAPGISLLILGWKI